MVFQLYHLSDERYQKMKGKRRVVWMVNGITQRVSEWYFNYTIWVVNVPKNDVWHKVLTTFKAIFAQVPLYTFYPS